MTKSEFVVTQSWTTDLRSPLRWIWSHTRRNKLVILNIFIGAAGNAGLAAALPIFTGMAFDALLKKSPNLRVLLWAAILIVISQLVRSILQLGRNFGSEVL